MASRHRYNTSQPTPSRHAIAATPGPSRAGAPADRLPPYQKPSHPLNRRAQSQLAAVYDRQTASSLSQHNKRAEELVTDAAGLINDRLREREERVERRRKKWEKGEHIDERDGEERELVELRVQVDEMTKRLEEGMRGVIDGGEALLRLEESINWLRGHAPGALRDEYTTQVTQRSQSEAQSQRKRGRGEAEDEEDEDEDEGSSPGPTPLNMERIALTGTSEMYAERLQRRKTEYLTFSHGARYSKNNAYIGFKKMVHDAKYGDNGPPMQHPDTWFTETGSPAPGITAALNGADEDDDIVIDKATISTRCPLTLQPFVEPYTSKKCPHSFEMDHVLDFIRRSNIRVGGGVGRGQGERAIQCPVAGCDQLLTANDLAPDPILIRKIKRMQAIEARRADESDMEDDVSPRRRTAEESRSPSDDVFPVTQQSIVLDLGSGDEDEDE